MAKIRSFGAACTIAGTAIGGLTSIDITGGDVNAIDITTHDSADGYKEYTAGLKDAGTLELSGKHDSADAGQDLIVTHEGTVREFIITFSDTKTATFDAIVGIKSIPNPLDDAVDFSVSCKITGKVTYSA